MPFANFGASSLKSIKSLAGKIPIVRDGTLDRFAKDHRQTDVFAALSENLGTTL